MSVRIGFIGAGGIAGVHTAALAGMPDVEVVALCDVAPGPIEATRERVNARLAKQGSPRTLDAAAYTDYHAMLRDERLSAVYVCLPPFAHGEPEEAVVAAGVPMLVEKPVALDLARAARVLDAIKERQLLVAVGYQYRYSPTLHKAREFLEGHTVGQVVAMRFGSTPRTSWFHRQDRSGGQMIEMATHQIDMLRYLAGEVRTVYGAGATRINNRERPEYDIFDVNALTLSFESGAVGTFAGNFITDHATHLDDWGVHVFCDGLVLSLGDSLRVSTPDGTQEFPFEQEPMALEDAAFVRAVAEGRPDLIQSDYENGLRTLAVTLAADRSQRTGQPVDLREMLRAEVPGL